MQTNSELFTIFIFIDTPTVKLHVILDDLLDGNETTSTPDSGSTHTNNNVIGHNPIVLESQHRNVTLRCAVSLEPDQQHMADETNDDPSLNLTSVYWYWNGVQMQLPNCTRSSDFDGDAFDEDEDGDGEFSSTPENDNNGMNVNYFTSETHEESGDYESFTVDNDTRRRNRKQRKVVCTDRDLILVNVTKNIHGNYSCKARNAAGLLSKMSTDSPLVVYCECFNYIIRDI